MSDTTLAQVIEFDDDKITCPDEQEVITAARSALKALASAIGGPAVPFRFPADIIPLMISGTEGIGVIKSVEGHDNGVLSFRVKYVADLDAGFTDLRVIFAP